MKYESNIHVLLSTAASCKGCRYINTILPLNLYVFIELRIEKSSYDE